jgi:UDP-N-acetylmuramate dehydrogenase
MIKQYTDVSLLKRNTFGIEAKAARLVEFSSVDALVDFLAGGFSGNSLVIGGGSNLLFVDDFDGTVFHSTIMDIDVVGESADDVLLRVGSGVNWDALVAYTVEKGWCGLENLSLIPGEVGASAVQNVGAYGVEAGDLIEKVETVRIADAVACSFTKADCDFAYRHSIFKAGEKGRHIVTYVTYRLQKSACFKLSYGNLKDKVEELGGATLANVRRAVCEIREAKLPNPNQVGSAGSFFMNPIVDAAKAAVLKEEYPAMPQYALADGCVKLSAGWLIEQCGWKQTPHPHVGVYEKQALVVVNRGGATGIEVMEFATAVVESVKEKFGITLHMEVNVIS